VIKLVKMVPRYTLNSTCRYLDGPTQFTRVWNLIEILSDVNALCTPLSNRRKMELIVYWWYSSSVTLHSLNIRFYHTSEYLLGLEETYFEVSLAPGIHIDNSVCSLSLRLNKTCLPTVKTSCGTQNPMHAPQGGHPTGAKPPFAGGCGGCGGNSGGNNNCGSAKSSCGGGAPACAPGPMTNCTSLLDTKMFGRPPARPEFGQCKTIRTCRHSFDGTQFYRLDEFTWYYCDA